MNIHAIIGDTVFPRQLEVIERKGFGHPDTLADGLAEALSRTYANFTRDRYGAILHHNFDKVGLLGGRAHVEFGTGHLTAPIRVLINGRATERFNGEQIPVRELLEITSKEFLTSRLDAVVPERDLEFHHNLSTASSPGHLGDDSTAGNRSRWFHPKSLDDLRERKVLQSNDTSAGCGFWPLTVTEQLVLELEGALTNPASRHTRPWLGTDIKVMACRVDRKLDLTLCIPQISNAVPNVESYRANLVLIREEILATALRLLDGHQVKVWLNTKDDFDVPELYLTAIGSSIESGDEGLVGRGNRVNGLIAMGRPYSMEGVCGKNPVYHVGKLYNILAIQAARRIYETLGVANNVWLIGQEGRRLDDPWQAVVASENHLPLGEVKRLLEETLAALPATTDRLLSGSVQLF